MKRIIAIDEQAFIDALRHAFAEGKEPPPQHAPATR